MDKQLSDLATLVGRHLTAQGKTLATAESCTGGWIAKTITDVPGCSAWFDRGFVTYCNKAKQDMLGVPEQTLASHGAVSEQTARAMVAGALAHSDADCAVAVTGIAGPDGGSLDKPVGTVFIAWLTRGEETTVVRKDFLGNREQVRVETVKTALEGCLLRC